MNTNGTSATEQAAQNTAAPEAATTEATKPEGNKPEQEAAKGQDFKAITSQDQLDQIIKTRLERERAKYADYDEL